MITQEDTVENATLAQRGYMADTESTYEVTPHPVASRTRSHDIDSEENPHNILSALMKHQY